MKKIFTERSLETTYVRIIRAIRVSSSYDPRKTQEEEKYVIKVGEIRNCRRTSEQNRNEDRKKWAITIRERDYCGRTR